MTLDTLTFTLHHCQQVKSRAFIDEGEYQNDRYLYPTSHKLYLALKEYDNKYIERRIDLQHMQQVDNTTPMDLLGKKVVKRSFVRSPKTLLISQDKEVLYTKNTIGKATLKSSNYNIVFNIKSSQDAIEFTFSVPKYMYGHSVAQYLPNQNSNRFMRYTGRMIEPSFQNDLFIERLNEFIEVFLKDLGYMFNFVFEYHPEQIEIRRLDFCYNQITPSKQHALALIDAQKKIYRKRLRKDNKTNDFKDTSVYYRNSDRTFFFKIYHKGSEFNKVGDSDFKRLMSFNQDYFEENYMKRYNDFFELKQYLPTEYKNMEVGSFFSFYKSSAMKYVNIDFVREFEKFMPYKVFFLLVEADRIVRYEMQFTNTYMSSLYKRRVYCKASRDYKKLRVSMNRVQSYYDAINKGRSNKAKEIRRKYRLNRVDFDDYEAMDSFIRTTNTFWLKCSSEVEHSEHSFHYDNRIYRTKTKYKVDAYTEASLSTELIHEMYDVFMKEVQFFQIKNIANPLTLLDKVDKHNEDAIKRRKKYIKDNGDIAYKKLTRATKMKRGMIEFNRTRLKLFLEEFDKGKSLQQIREEYQMPKSTYYDLRKILETFSLNEQKIKSRYDFSSLRLDYLDYYRKLNEAQYHRNFFSPDYKCAMRSDSHLFQWSK